MVGDPAARHPSKPWRDGFPFTSTTEGLPTEEQSHGTEL